MNGKKGEVEISAGGYGDPKGRQGSVLWLCKSPRYMGISAGGYGDLFLGDRNVLNVIVMATQLCNLTKNH